MKKRSYTIIPNEVLGANQLSLPARYLYCVLLKHSGQDDKCFPSQDTLALTLGYTPRHIRTLLTELVHAGLVYKVRHGWNRANNYYVAKHLYIERKDGSYHIGSSVPLHQGNPKPPKSTYLKGKGKRSIKGLELLSDVLQRHGLLKKR